MPTKIITNTDRKLVIETAFDGTKVNLVRGHLGVSLQIIDDDEVVINREEAEVLFKWLMARAQE